MVSFRDVRAMRTHGLCIIGRRAKPLAPSGNHADSPQTKTRCTGYNGTLECMNDLDTFGGVRVAYQALLAEGMSQIKSGSTPASLLRCGHSSTSIPGQRVCGSHDSPAEEECRCLIARKSSAGSCESHWMPPPGEVRLTLLPRIRCMSGSRAQCHSACRRG